MQETSLQAYASVNIAKREAEVLNAIATLQPCSNQTIAKALGFEINRVTGRTNGLMKKGLVKEYDKQVNEFNRSVIRWVIVNKQLTLGI